MLEVFREADITRVQEKKQVTNTKKILSVVQQANLKFDSFEYIYMNNNIIEKYVLIKYE